MSVEEKELELKRDNWYARRKSESKFSKYWRPAMGWMYMAVCIFDFIIFPFLWSLYLGHLKQPVTQWVPLTLQATGFFHVAMGAVIGIAAWKRTEEKLNDRI
jgi:hypothetical protein